MLSGFRSSFLGRLSPPAGKGRAAYHPLEALWGTQVEARCPPIGDDGRGFTSPYYYWENIVTRSKMLPIFVSVFLAFLLFQWTRFSASLTSHSIDFCSRSHFFSSSKLLWLQLSSQSSASLLSNFSASLLIQSSQKKCPLSPCSHLLFIHWPISNLASTLLLLVELCNIRHYLPLLPVVSLCLLSSAA